MTWLKTAYPGANLFTIFREPRVRLLSLWIFSRSRPRKAIKRLSRFSHIDVVENPDMFQRLTSWMKVPVTHVRSNENDSIADDLKSPIDKELNVEALRLLDMRTAIDRVIWRRAVEYVARDADVHQLANLTFSTAIKRYTDLMSRAEHSS